MHISDVGGRSRRAAISFSERSGEVCAVAIDIPSLGIVSTTLPQPSLGTALSTLKDKLQKRGYETFLRQEAQAKESFPYEALEKGERVAVMIHRFCRGEKVEFPEDIDLHDMTLFRIEILLAVKSIPRGRAASYSWVAERIGHPKAYRAVGSVMATNPLPPIVPCHRVVKANRELGNFGSGVHLKRRLLIVEGVELQENLVSTRSFLG